MSSVGQLAAAITTGEGLSLGGASVLFPPSRAGRPVHPTTLMRWVIDGVTAPGGRRVKLAAVRVGSRWLTTRAAVAEFIQAQQPAEVVAGPVPRTGDKRAASVEKELAEMGV